MGVASLSVIYASIILSSMFLPPILIKNLGCKWTIVASMGCYVAYSFGNIYPGWETLITTSVILGLGGSPLWSAKCTYLTISGNLQAEKDNKRGPDVVNQYFGIFFLIFQSSAVWGNLMSSLIFGQDTEIAEIPEEGLKFCGAGSCEYTGEAAGNSTRPPDTLVYTLLGSYIGVGVLAMIFVAVFLDNLDRDAAREFRDNRDPFWTVFLATFKHLSDKRQILLIPLTMYSGFEQGFLAGDYTKGSYFLKLTYYFYSQLSFQYYVTCALGIHFVGFVMICFGATNSLCSYAFGKLAQYTGRAALFGLATVSNFSIIIALLLWKPHPDQLAVFFVFPALWGMADAVWQTQTNALYGVLFHEHKEAAFANYRLWESVGFVIAFAYSNFICLDIKLYVLIGVLVVSMALYGLVEYKEYKNPTVREDNVLKKVPEMLIISETKF
ncbi:UN93A protein, partial [Atractosteus spatula]|nr:UN93A protein [Atractosteus spatula]